MRMCGDCKFAIWDCDDSLVGASTYYYISDCIKDRELCFVTFMNAETCDEYEEIEDEVGD